MWWQDLDPSIYIAVILGAIIVVLAVEAIRHRLALKHIPYRIHVNGTRGKSSVARLIAAGLRAGGIRTCAKTTGTLARFIDPDGNEEAIYRMGHTNVIEQVGVVRKAKKLGCQALVIECMALQPLLQSLCELKLVRSTHGVLTNARPDHLDVMGPLEEDVALALAGTVTVKGEYFTAEQKHAPLFQRVAQERGSRFHGIGDAECASIHDDEIARFSYHEFKENVALALSVCASLGVDRQVALEGMWAAMPDPGAMSIYQVSHNGHRVYFANAFAANDPVSTTTLWEKLLADHPEAQSKTLIVNCRADRHERSAQMGEAVLGWQAPDDIVLVGTGTETFVHTCKKLDNNKAKTLRFTEAEGWSVEQILAHVTRDADPTVHLVVGVSNIAGIGLDLVEFFRQRKETA